MREFGDQPAPDGDDKHGIEGADTASAVMVAGILTAHMARWIDDGNR